VGRGALPSKSFSILASGRPLLASVDEDSDLVSLVQRAEAGICVPPESPELLGRAVLQLRDDPTLCRRYGENGRAYALKFHSPATAAREFEKLLREIVGEPCPETGAPSDQLSWG